MFLCRAFGLVLALFVLFASCRVIELDNNFGSQRYQGKWLVMFYAPWCHHCRALESTWTQVGNDFHNSDVNVGRLDCTKYQKVASEFRVRGYPTVLYIYGDHIVEYEGDRTKNDMVEFARKTDGPVVRALSDKNELQNAVKNQDVFFLYVTEDPDIVSPDADQQKQRQQTKRDVLIDANESGRVSTDPATLIDVVEKQAKEMRKYLYFYSAQKHQVTDMFAHADKYPALFVYNSGQARQFRAVNASDAASWLVAEQFPIMPKLSGSLLRRVYDAGRKIVVAVLDETQVEGKVSKISGHVKNKLLQLAKQRYSSNQNDLLFSWSNGNELVNTLTYTHHETPALVVLDPQNETYYVPDLPTAGSSTIADMPIDDVEEFLYNVTFNKARARGGKRIHNKIYRLIYQLASFVYRVFSTQPIFACVLFGLPLGVLAVICVVMWSADFSDNNAEGPRRRNRGEIAGVGGHHNAGEDGEDDDDDDDLDDDEDYDDDENINHANGGHMNDGNESEVEEVDDDALMQMAVEQQGGDAVRVRDGGGGVRNEAFDAGVEALSAGEAAARAVAAAAGQ